MKRRKFISLLGGAVAVLPFAARAERSTLPTIGILGGESPDKFASSLAAFYRGLREHGFVGGQNVAVEYRWAENNLERLPALASDLVQHHVSVIAALQGSRPAVAAKAATSTIPIVFANGGDPVKLGLVARLNRPSGNVTGISFLLNALAAKRLELLHELVPSARVIGFLVNPTNPSYQIEQRDVQEAARLLGLELVIVSASSADDIAVAFASLAQRRIGAFVNAADVFFDRQREQIVALSAEYALPAMYHTSGFARSGGLISYGTSVDEAHRLAGTYTGRILKAGCGLASQCIRPPIGAFESPGHHGYQRACDLIRR